MRLSSSKSIFSLNHPFYIHLNWYFLILHGLFSLNMTLRGKVIFSRGLYIVKYVTLISPWVYKRVGYITWIPVMADYLVITLESCYDKSFISVVGGSEILFLQANIANCLFLPNWPWPMKESINLIGGLTYLNTSKSWVCKMSDIKSSTGWTLMVLYSFHDWTRIV